MHTKPSVNKRAEYSSDADMMMIISKSDIRILIFEDACRIYADRTQAVVQNQRSEALVDLVQLGNNAAMNWVRKAPARFLETIVIQLFSCGAADNVISEYFEWRSQLDTFINAAMKQMVSNPWPIRPVAEFIKWYVNTIIHKCRLTQLYAESEKFDKKAVFLPPSKSPSAATKSTDKMPKRERTKNGRS